MREALFGYLDFVVAGKEIWELIITGRVGGRLPLDAGVHVGERYFRAWDHSPLRVSHVAHDCAANNDLCEQGGSEDEESEQEQAAVTTHKLLLCNGAGPDERRSRGQQSNPSLLKRFNLNQPRSLFPAFERCQAELKSRTRPLQSHWDRGESSLGNSLRNLAHLDCLSVLLRLGSIMHAGGGSNRLADL